MQTAVTQQMGEKGKEGRNEKPRIISRDQKIQEEI